MSSLRVAVDIGGTFTDLIASDETTGGVLLSKTSTTPKDLTVGVNECVEKGNVNLNASTFFIHGSTVVINAILEEKGAKTGLITTKGFRDVYEIGQVEQSHQLPAEAWGAISLPYRRWWGILRPLRTRSRDSTPRRYKGLRFHKERKRGLRGCS